MARPGQPSVAARNSFLCFFLSLLFVYASGCSVGNYLSAYFNTYYNAQRDFSEAEDELLTQLELRQSDTTYLAPFTVPPNAKTKFVSVIERGSKLLQYHSESGLVDDALMMIGKSYYYQNDNQQAERKFRELLDQFPESDFALDARQLLANTLYRSGEFSASRDAARELLELAASKDEERIVSSASMLLATIEYDNKNLSAARDYYQKAAENGATSAEQFRGYLRAAEMSVKLADYESAERSYLHARGVAETYATEYKARIGFARMESKLGRHEESVSELEDLLSDPKNRELFGEVDLEIGNVYRDMGDIEAAITQYHYVDTAYTRTEFAAKSYYERGLLYEKTLMQYDSARVAYNKGRVEAPQATAITSLLGERAEYMNKYAMLRAEIIKNDSLKELILHPPVIVNTVHSADSSKMDSTAMGAVSERIKSNLTAAETPKQMDSLPVIISDSTELGMADSSGMALMAPDSLGMQVVLNDSSGVRDSTKVSKPKLVTIPLDTVEARLAYAKSELASLFYTSLGITDSAAHWYHTLLVDHPDNEHVPQAWYTLVQIYSQDSTAKKSVDSLNHLLVERFPESEFAVSARKALGIAPPKPKKDEALELYSRADDLRASGKTKEAISTFKTLVKKYPDSPLASKAQFAIGWLYEETLPRPDSSLTNYQRLVTLYPNTEYARVAKSKLDAVEQHRQQVEAQRVADSLTQVQEALEKKSTSLRDTVSSDSTNMNPVQKAAPPEKVGEMKKENEGNPDPPGEEPLEKPRPR